MVLPHIRESGASNRGALLLNRTRAGGGLRCVCGPTYAIPAPKSTVRHISPPLHWFSTPTDIISFVSVWTSASFCIQSMLLTTLTLGSNSFEPNGDLLWGKASLEMSNQMWVWVVVLEGPVVQFMAARVVVLDLLLQRCAPAEPRTRRLGGECAQPSVMANLARAPLQAPKHPE